MRRKSSNSSAVVGGPRGRNVDSLSLISRFFVCLVLAMQLGSMATECQQTLSTSLTKQEVKDTGENSLPEEMSPQSAIRWDESQSRCEASDTMRQGDTPANNKFEYHTSQSMALRQRTGEKEVQQKMGGLVSETNDCKRREGSLAVQALMSQRSVAQPDCDREKAVQRKGSKVRKDGNAKKMRCRGQWHQSEPFQMSSTEVPGQARPRKLAVAKGRLQGPSRFWRKILPAGAASILQKSCDGNGSVCESVWDGWGSCTYRFVDEERREGKERKEAGGKEKVYLAPGAPRAVMRGGGGRDDEVNDIVTTPQRHAWWRRLGTGVMGERHCHDITTSRVVEEVGDRVMEVKSEISCETLGPSMPRHITDISWLSLAPILFLKSLDMMILGLARCASNQNRASSAWLFLLQYSEYLARAPDVRHAETSRAAMRLTFCAIKVYEDFAAQRYCIHMLHDREATQPPLESDKSQLATDRHHNLEKTLFRTIPLHDVAALHPNQHLEPAIPTCPSHPYPVFLQTLTSVSVPVGQTHIPTPPPTVSVVKTHPPHSTSLSPQPGSTCVTVVKHAAQAVSEASRIDIVVWGHILSRSRSSLYNLWWYVGFLGGDEGQEGEYREGGGGHGYCWIVIDLALFMSAAPAQMFFFF
ncbi:uncharacterized protein MYCFIDRAFT_177009 [Pseudocercospora fijiensis CIRAD86]|uniref:Uncharacterized protein n=1 Tax=Pseudocercospora fijiensis (strain CIRAD86) TaxID=383855 RepID=M2YQK8_PSEFD|nr:uncharacterized protein MYCFIDRAFT_177009 [Pseudocercospora fijiensis CIRAD86]EME80020.1 hypothetical protein MYCFIDRAFT_177009 [Pseudocercospora fijiensis CIRAD86]